MEMLNSFYEILNSPFFVWFVSSLFLIGYVWGVKVDNVDDVAAEHINTLQTEKIDRDGQVEWTGTSQWKKGADIVSAATLLVGADGNYFDVTGSITITKITAARSQPGTVIKLHIDAGLTIVHDDDFIELPEDRDLHVPAHTDLEFTEYTPDKWRCTGFAKGQPVLTNIISNSEFRVWSLADVNKGLATIAYVNLAGAFAPGDTITGVDSGAVGKVKTDNGVNSMTLGAVTGTFIDGEEIGNGADTADVNGDKSIGVTNDPCNNDDTADWDQDGDSLGFDTGWYEWATSAIDKICYKGSLTFTKDKLYKIEIDLKDGVANPTDIKIYFYDGAEQLGEEIDTTGGFVKHTATFKCATSTAAGRAGVKAPTSLGGNDIEIRRLSCYEITPCCTATNTKTEDLHSRTSSIDCYQVKDDSVHIEKSYYGLELIKTVDGGEYYNFNAITDVALLDQVRGRQVTFGCYVYDAGGGDDNVKLQLRDGIGTTESEFVVSGSKQWIEITRIIAPNATSFLPRILLDGDAGDIAYFSPIMVVFGTNIGKGNYQPKVGEWIYLDLSLHSNRLYNHDKFGDVAWTLLNIEADSDGRLPKICKAVMIYTDIKDSGSLASDVSLQLRADSGRVMYVNSPYGLPNDIHSRVNAIMACDFNGNIEYNIVASNGTTFDLDAFIYGAVQIN